MLKVIPPPRRNQKARPRPLLIVARVFGSSARNWGVIGPAHDGRFAMSIRSICATTGKPRIQTRTVTPKWRDLAEVIRAW